MHCNRKNNYKIIQIIFYFQILIHILFFYLSQVLKLVKSLHSEPRGPRGPYQKKYMQEDVEMALELVKAKNMSICAAAKKFDILHNTLVNK